MAIFHQHAAIKSLHLDFKDRGLSLFFDKSERIDYVGDMTQQAKIQTDRPSGGVLANG